ncbi:MAG: Tn3 family transposase [Candidatus Omnitrophota bacterium]
MSTNIKILTPSGINSFDTPPTLNADERKQFFRPSKTVKDRIASLRTRTNKICFVLLHGYFKATNKFFRAKDFLKSEIDFVCGHFNIPSESVNFTQYEETTLERHQEIVLDLLGCAPFTDETKRMLLKEASGLCSRHMKPEAILLSLVDFLKEKRIEVPRYYVLAEIITTALNKYEDNILSSLEMLITKEDKHNLDGFLESHSSDRDSSAYNVTTLKKNSHSLRPVHIKTNIKDLIYLKKLYNQLCPVITKLDLDIQTIQYYAGFVMKASAFQMFKQKGINRYLHLLCFLIHRYYTLNDLLIDALIHANQNAHNTALRKHQEYYYENRNQKQVVTEEIIAITKISFQEIKNVIFNDVLSDPQKVQAIQLMFLKEPESNKETIEDKISKLEADYGRIKDDRYYDFLEDASIKLQNRVSEIIKHICFDQDSSDKKILQAIDYYKIKDGTISKDAPRDFLNEAQVMKIFADDKKPRVSLYKVFLFHEIAGGIKSGALNLLYSYKYRAFDHYLIPKKSWEENRLSLLEKSELIGFEDFNKVIKEISSIINIQLEVTNKRILNLKNPFVRIGADNKLIVNTPPAKDKETSGAVMDLFPHERYFSLFEILSTVNKVTPFINSLKHWKTKGHGNRPDSRTIIAGIIGLGCNLGISKIARISNSISAYALENTVNWYFSNDGLNNANDKILEVVDQLSLAHVFLKDLAKIHTSSDGQKFGIGVDSLHANHSCKYFGKGEGVSIYTFNDEQHKLFYSTVISPAEREAAYVIDGLMQNDVVKSDIHSTDTHGYTEIVFAVTHLLGISFAPRIRDFRDQRLFATVARSTFKDLGYKIIPDMKIDLNSIEAEWDNILRLVATVRLKHTTASQLFQRLSHYSRQHPLYRAIKNFGKLIKTIFLLRYIDDVELRQTIEKQLNKTESIHKFAKAVFFGSNQEFQQRTKEDQLKTDSCKRLIENAIICWNYLYLSDLIAKTKDPAERERIVNIIKNGSVVLWQHVNLQGEYDFSDDALKNSLNFSLPKLIQLEVA